MYRSLIPAILAFLLLPPVLRTQSRVEEGHRVRFDLLRVEQGLSQGAVSALLQDQQGFLWIGTDDGLNRFDGYQFLVFRPDPSGSNSIASNVVTSLAEGSHGMLWIGTRGAGFQALDTRTRTFMTPSLVSSNQVSLKGSVITALQMDRRERVWIGTESDGLHVYDPRSNTLRNIPLMDEDSRESIASITATRSGKLLIAARSAGLFIVDEGGTDLQRLELPDGNGAAVRGRSARGRSGRPAVPSPSPRVSVTGVLVQSERYIWITTADGRLLRHDVRTADWDILRLGGSDAAPTFRASGMALDGGENLWVGTTQHGALRYDIRSSRWQLLVHNPIDPTTLPGNSVRVVYADRLGNLWVGTNGNGLGLYSPASKEFDLVSPGTYGIDRLPVHSFRGIWQGADSVLWLGGYGGFCRVDRKDGTVLFTRGDDTGLPSESLQGGKRGRRFTNAPLSTVFCMLPEDEAGTDRLLAGTEGDGLYRLDTRSLRFEKIWPRAADSLAAEQELIYELARSRDGTIWIGTERGLFRWVGSGPHRRPQRVAAADFGNRQGAVYAVLEDSNGFLWVGTDRGGLAYYDRLTGDVTFFTHLQGNTQTISSNSIRCIYEDSRGMLWVGTTAGLNQMNVGKGTFRHITTSDGLPNNVIYGILEDVSGYLWLSTNRGLARYHPDEGVVATYDVHDGLQGNEFNTGSAFQSLSGEMFFGGVRGVTHFYPEQITRNLTVPPVAVTAVRAGNREVPLRRSGLASDTVVLDHRVESIGISFAALSFYRPEKNRYRYRIDGRDDEFIDLGTDHFLSFAGLSPGSYVIHIQGSNNDGTWNLHGTTLTLVIEPPFWGSWWFQLFAGVLVTMILIGGFRWRMGRVRSQEKLLAEEVAHRTSELQHSNAKLLAEIEERKRAEAEAYRANATKTEFLAHISHEIRTPMNAILGFTDLLQDRIREEEQRNYLNSIVVSGKTLLTLINDVLDLSKIEAGKLELSYRPASIRAIAEEIRQLFVYQLRQKNLAFDITVDSAVPASMYLDEIRIRQILLNLVGNAVKFTRTGGIQLEIGCTKTDAQRCRLHISITDTGVGIAPSQQEHVFEPFRQGGRGRNTDYGGTGLGLTITQRLVHMMEGDIKYTSRLGVGTTFRVTLPGVLVDRDPHDDSQTPQQDAGQAPPRPQMHATPVDAVPAATDSVAKEKDASATGAPVAAEVPDPVLLSALHADLLASDFQRWERLTRTYLMHEIEGFATELKWKGERAAYPPLTEWSERLLRDVRNFDMEQLPRTLNEFPRILAVLNDLGNPSPPQSDTSAHE